MSYKGQPSPWDPAFEQIEGFPDYKIKLRRPMKKWFTRWIKADAELNVIISMSHVVEAVLDFHIETKLRKHLGEPYAKNFENARRSKHSITAPTKKLLEDSLGYLTSLFPTTPLENPDGPLTPEARQLVTFSEYCVTTCTNVSMLKDSISCPHCFHENYIPTIDWWGRTDLGLSHETAIIIDRLLLLNLSVFKSTKFLHDALVSVNSELNKNKLHAGNCEANEIYPAWLSFFDNNRLPMGHWLDLIRRSHNAENLNQLSEILSFLPGTIKTGDDISHSRLRKWSSGQQLPRANTAIATISDLDNRWALQLSYYSARLSMLSLDIILASSHTKISNTEALTFLKERFHELANTDDSIVKI